MRILSQAILYLLITPFLASAQAANEDTIRWKANKKLNWSDYKGNPDPNSDAAASTTTYLGVEYHMENGRFECKITCSFSRTKSWGRHKNDHVLSHEQGHFDIAEIFARKLNREMKKYSFNRNNYTSDLKRIYQDIVNQKEAWQNLYDDETDHSIRKEKQAEWLRKIALELEELRAFANY